MMDKMYLLARWHEAQSALQQAKETEAELRKQVVEEFFSQVPQDAEGTFSLPLGGGYKLKTQYKLARKVNAAALQEIKADLEASGVDVDALVHWTPSVVMGQYRTLSMEQKQLFDEVIESKQSTPSISIEAPKPQEG